MTNVFVGVRVDDCLTVVRVNGKILDPRHDAVNHSPDGFNWGYSGSGPAQLAYAILAEEYGDDWDGIPQTYQIFKDRMISSIKDPMWIMTSQDVRSAVSNIREDSALLT
jgi:hypothetical protein